MKYTVEIHLIPASGTARVFQLTQTQEASKNKAGKVSLAHWQPTEDNPVLKPFGKLYVDEVELAKSSKA